MEYHFSTFDNNVPKKEPPIILFLEIIAWAFIAKRVVGRYRQSTDFSVNLLRLWKIFSVSFFTCQFGEISTGRVR